MNQLILANALLTVWNFFWNGGIFMLLLLLTSVLSFTLIIWRILALKRELIIPKTVEAAVAEFTPTEANLANLLELLRKHDSPFSRIVLQACRQFNWTKSENLTALQTQARKEIHQMEGGLTMLEIITGLAPLLGLLGTVAGLVQVFSSLGSGGASAAETAGIAGGIAQALNTTIMGLAVAIPSLIAFSIFSKRVEWLAVDMETNIEGLLAKCYHEPYMEDHGHAQEADHATMNATAPEAEPAEEALPDKTDPTKDKQPEGTKEKANEKDKENPNRSSTSAKKPAAAAAN